MSHISTAPVMWNSAWNFTRSPSFASIATAVSGTPALGTTNEQKHTADGGNSIIRERYIGSSAETKKVIDAY